MEWNYNKPTANKTRAEVELSEVFDYIQLLELKLQKLEAVVDCLYFKVQISHSLTEIPKLGKADQNV